MASVLADPELVIIVVQGEPPLKVPFAMSGREATAWLQARHGAGFLHSLNDNNKIAIDQYTLALGTVHQYTRVPGTTTVAVATATGGAAASSATVAAGSTAAEGIAIGSTAAGGAATNGTAADGAATGGAAPHGTAAVGSPAADSAAAHGTAAVGSTVAGGAGTDGAAAPRAVTGGTIARDASTAGYSVGLVTARQAICSPCPPLALRTSPRASSSKTRPVRPKTFSSLEELTGFDAALQSLTSRLDDTVCRHIPVVVEGGQFLRAADESEVRAVFTALAPLINSVAKRMNIEAMLIGGGNNVSMSSTAWTILATTAVGSNSSSSGSSPSAAAAAAATATTASSRVADPATPAATPIATSSAAAVSGNSSRVYGGLEIKGDWQAKLYLGEQLWLITDEQEMKRFTPPLQQLYGDMVHDEVMWGMLSCVNESVIVQRHRDVSNKTLFVSRVFGTDELLLALLYLTEQATQDAPTKQQLKREMVTVTPAESYTYTVSLPAVPAWRSASGRVRRVKPASQFTVHMPSARPAKRQRQLEAVVDAIAGDSSSASITGGSLQQRFPCISSDSSSSWRCSALHSRFPHLVQLNMGCCIATPDVQRSASNIEGALEVTLHGIDFSRVKTTSVLASGRHGKVYKGSLDSQDLVVKTYDLTNPDALEAFDTELCTYAQTVRCRAMQSAAWCTLVCTATELYCSLRYHQQVRQWTKPQQQLPTCSRACVQRSTSCISGAFCMGIFI